MARFEPRITVEGYPVATEMIRSACAVATYTQDDYAQIATAVGKHVLEVIVYQKDFENAALMFRLDGGLLAEPMRSRGSTPTQLRRKIRQVERSARRLLKDLGIPRDEQDNLKIEEAYDGPGDTEVLKVLSWAEAHDEDPVILATRRLGRLAEISEAISAAANIEKWARQGNQEVTEFGHLTVPKGNQGDAAVNHWIAAMLPLYTQISGNDPGTSVGSPGTDNEGIAGGPLIRFLEAAGKPLSINYSSEAWRSRIRGILPSQQN